MKKLPIGIQTFEKIRENNYIYVDKTEIALNLIENEGYYFLSRPRRFGKSLFLSTLKAIFQGKKELFKDLYIYDKWDFNVTYPVIYISFAEGVLKSRDRIIEKIEKIFRDNQENLGIDCKPYNSMNICFEELIKKAYEKYNQKVVILVDEYDKPILDNITDIEIATIMREELKNIYSVIKGADEYIKFAFLTGVSKFSKTSIFSGLNNIEDITLNENYATICGYRQNDLETSFKEHLKGVNFKELKKWYNGYNFLGEGLYNPFDILLFISNNNKFKNYWFETGTPTFLINLIKENRYYLPDFENLKVDENLLDSFDIGNLSLEAIMFQSGYLTIKDSKSKRGKTSYRLYFPNFEVRTSFFDYLLDTIVTPIERVRTADKIIDILEEANLNELESLLKRLFSSIAYQNFTNNYIKNYEGFYASVIYAFFCSLGIEVKSEDPTNKGRIDLTLIVDDFVYIFEFKVLEQKSEVNSALEQIKEKDYASKYLDKKRYLIGIEFCKEEKNICSFEWEEL